MGLFDRFKQPRDQPEPQQTNQTQQTGTRADKLADKAEQIAAKVATGRTSPVDGCSELKKIQAELKGMDRAGRARARVRTAADSVFAIRDAQVPGNVEKAKQITQRLAATGTSDHPGPAVKATRKLLKDLYLGPHHKELHTSFNAVADELFNQYRKQQAHTKKIKDREYAQKSRDAKAKLQQALKNKEDYARKLDDQIRNLTVRENEADSKRRGSAHRLSSNYGTWGKTPYRRNHDQRRTEERVVGLETKIANIRKWKREAEAKKRQAGREIRDMRSKLSSWR